MAEWQTRCLQVAVIFRSCGFKSHQPHHYFTMDNVLTERIRQWNITSVLPLRVGDFKLTEEFRMITEDGHDKEFIIFSYQDSRNGWSVRATFNPVSEEYAVRTDICMLEFALIEFITGDFDVFTHMVEKRLPQLIQCYYVNRSANFTVIFKNKGIAAVNWEELLPKEYKGFKRLIEPSQAVRIINGSYMIVSYYQKETRSGLSVMYNILRDDFFAEQRVHNFPNLVHDFDGHDLKKLEVSLGQHLTSVLDGILAES